MQNELKPTYRIMLKNGTEYEIPGRDEVQVPDRVWDDLKSDSLEEQLSAVYELWIAAGSSSGSDTKADFITKALAHSAE